MVEVQNKMGKTSGDALLSCAEWNVNVLSDKSRQS